METSLQCQTTNPLRILQKHIGEGGYIPFEHGFTNKNEFVTLNWFKLYAVSEEIAYFKHMFIGRFLEVRLVDMTDAKICELITYITAYENFCRYEA